MRVLLLFILLQFSAVDATVTWGSDSSTHPAIQAMEDNLCNLLVRAAHTSMARADRNRDYSNYNSSMNSSMIEKLEVLEPYLPSDKGALIVDVGTGTGKLASLIASEHPSLKVRGIDISEKMVGSARKANPPLPNLSFKHAPANLPFAKDAAVAYYSSIVHEIYSYSGDSMVAVNSAFRTAFKSLRKSGKIVIRDFVRPEDTDRKVLVSFKKDYIVAGHSVEDFARDFGRPMHFSRVRETSEDVTYETDLGTAYEFICRKDFHLNWASELSERYGFWNQEEALRALNRAGFVLSTVKTVRSDWVESEEAQGNFVIRDAGTGAVIPMPDDKIVLVGTKP
jgi:SAM-dependent methyltransferase